MFSTAVADLVNKTAGHLDDSGKTLVDSTAYVNALNEAQYMLCEKLRMFHKFTTLSSSDGVQTHNLPSDFMCMYDTDSVSYTDVDGVKRTLVESDYGDVRGFDDLTTATGTPKTYWVQGNKINFYPAPDYDGTGNISIEHYYYAADLDGGTVDSSRIYTVSVDYAATDQYDIILGNGDLTVTLPDATDYNGLILTIKNIGTGTVTIATISSQTIDGDPTKSLTSQWQILSVVSNGTNWNVLDE